MRAYLRLDPKLRRQKWDYPDGAFRAFVEMLCASESQPVRGRFESRELVKAMLGPRRRWIGYLLEHGDLGQEGEEFVVIGWQDWQEGDITVPERMARLRAKKAGAALVTPADTPDDTAPDTPARIAEAVGGGGKPLAASADDEVFGLPGADDPLTIVCELVMSAAPIEDRDFREKVADQTRLYTAEWVIAAYRKAYQETIAESRRPQRWTLSKRAEVHLATWTRAEELKAVKGAAQRAAEEREALREAAEQVSPEERERQSLIRQAIGIWIKGGRQGQVPTDLKDLRSWIEANGAAA